MPGPTDPRNAPSAAPAVAPASGESGAPPAAPSGGPPPAAPPARPAYLIDSARILVADDEASIRQGVERVLRADGHRVTAVEDGAAALEAYRAEPFDLVLLDLKMPNIDGLTLLPKLREIDPLAVCVMITGYASFETAVKAVQDGAYDYMPKPFTPNELRIVVRRGLERRFYSLQHARLAAEQQRWLRDLAHEKSQTRTIISAMADAVLVVNAAEELVLYNAAARQFLQPGAEPLGRPLVAACRVPALLEAVTTAKARLAGEVRAVALEVADAENRKTWLMNLAPLPADETGPTVPWRGLVLGLTDITPMKELENTKSRFVRMVAHELKAPVAAIEGYLELILGDLAPGQEEYRGKLERCRDRAALLQRMIRELLDLSRIEQGVIERRLEMIDPLAVLRECLELHQADAAKRGITLVVESDPAEASSTRLKADRDEIARVFTNLISNGIKYNRDGGRLTVSTRTVPVGWQVTFADTGIGIAEEHLRHLGEEFFRVKSSETVKISGTGLGMAIVQRTLQFYHARLEVASVKGEGTRFTITWPLECDAA